MNTEQVRPLVDWSLPANMPDNFVLLVRLVRLMFRARWGILEPCYQEMRFRGLTAERCGEIARSVVADCNRMRHYAESQGIVGLDKFYAVFQVDLRDQVEAYGDEWRDLVTNLASAVQPSAADIMGQLKGLLANNAKWLQISAKQFQIAMAELR